jgi:hypothetical protein
MNGLQRTSESFDYFKSSTDWRCAHHGVNAKIY